MSQLPEASIRTSNSLQLAERRRAAVPRGVATATPLFIERAENAEVWDVEGRRLIDFASGIAVLNTGQLIERANTLGELSRTRLAAMAARSDLQPIGHVRGLGAMVGFDILKERGGDDILAGGASIVARRAHELGLLLLTCGTQGEAIRLLFPLTAATELVEEGLELLARALEVA